MKASHRLLARTLTVVTCLGSADVAESPILASVLPRTVLASDGGGA